MGNAYTATVEALRRRGVVALNLAIVIAGGTAAHLGDRIGVSKGRVGQWRTSAVLIPIEEVARVCMLVNHPLVSPYTLRPDLADVWQMLHESLRACAEGRARTTPLDPVELDEVAALYPALDRRVAETES